MGAAIIIFIILCVIGFFCKKSETRKESEEIKASAIREMIYHLVEQTFDVPKYRNIRVAEGEGVVITVTDLLRSIS